MCLLCLDADELGNELPEERMADPWDNLKTEVLAALREGVSDFSGELRDAARAFLENQAATIAREKWRALRATTDEEREIAESNLRHLQGQIGAEIARLQLAANERAGALLERVISTAIGILIRVGPVLLGA